MRKSTERLQALNENYRFQTYWNTGCKVEIFDNGLEAGVKWPENTTFSSQVSYGGKVVKQFLHYMMHQSLMEHTDAWISRNLLEIKEGKYGLLP